MIEIKAKSDNDGVDIQNKTVGTGADIINESLAIIRSLRNGLIEADKGLWALFLVALVDEVAEWMSGEDSEGGENLA